MKRHYIYPEVQMTNIVPSSIILSGSAGDSFSISSSETGEVW